MWIMYIDFSLLHTKKRVQTAKNNTLFITKKKEPSGKRNKNLKSMIDFQIQNLKHKYRYNMHLNYKKKKKRERKN